MGQKYIINNSTLVMGHVEYHSQLLKDHSKTVGGGYWYVDEENKKVYLYSKSLEFKQARLADVIQALRNGKFPKNLSGYSFYYSHEESLARVLRDSTKIV